MATNNALNVGLSGASGTGSFAGTTSPTFVTPLLGTPTSGTLTNCTGYPGSSVTGTVAVANGGTGQTTYTDGQLLIGNTTGNTLAKSTLSSGSGVTITNGSGTITIAATGGGLTINNVTGTSATMVVNSLNIANNAGLVTLTLPATAAVGDIVEVKGSGAGGWIIAQNAGDIIHVGSVASTAGVGGSVASVNRYDCLTLCCIVANDEWVASGVQSSGLTVV